MLTIGDCQSYKQTIISHCVLCSSYCRRPFITTCRREEGITICMREEGLAFRMEQNIWDSVHAVDHAVYPLMIIKRDIAVESPFAAEHDMASAPLAMLVPMAG